jgi:aspartyl/asparaginyl beta-hydroxylase (cupin superfamily)
MGEPADGPRLTSQKKLKRAVMIVDVVKPLTPVLLTHCTPFQTVSLSCRTGRQPVSSTEERAFELSGPSVSTILRA